MKKLRDKLYVVEMKHEDVENTVRAIDHLDNMAELRKNLVTYQGDKDVAIEIYQTIMFTRNHLFKYRDLITLALGLKQVVKHDEESSVFGESGDIIELVDELSDTLDVLHDLIRL
jgi:hypothetical protein